METWKLPAWCLTSALFTSWRKVEGTTLQGRCSPQLPCKARGNSGPQRRSGNPCRCPSTSSPSRRNCGCFSFVPSSPRTPGSTHKVPRRNSTPVRSPAPGPTPHPPPEKPIYSYARSPEPRSTAPSFPPPRPSRFPGPTQLHPRRPGAQADVGAHMRTRPPTRPLATRGVPNDRRGCAVGLREGERPGMESG